MDAGDTEADGFGLTFDTATVHVDLEIELADGIGKDEGLVDNVLQRILFEILIEVFAVDDNVTGTGASIDASNC